LGIINLSLEISQRYVKQLPHLSTMSTLNLYYRLIIPLTVKRAVGRILPRQFSTTLVFRHDDSTSKSPPKGSRRHAGESARTDGGIRFQHPDSSSMPSPEPARGHGGPHLKPTLASFSLEGKVAAVTGGARGLGLVMAQGLMTSGAQVALVDLNGRFSNYFTRGGMSDSFRVLRGRGKRLSTENGGFV
jgi:hypothetical protein